jgi:fatty acid desaturase
MATTGAFDPSSVDLDAFMKDLAALRREIDASLGEEDLEHLRKIVRWGRTCTALGLLSAGLAPNPISAALLGVGKSTRWMLTHHMFHRAYDKVPGVPERYKGKVFARGRRRYLDYLDWVLPEGWAYEHMIHHAYTNEPRDPSRAEHPFDVLAGDNPVLVRYILHAIAAVAWRPLDYAPTSLTMWLERHEPKESRVLTPPEKWSRLRELFLTCYLPYMGTHFVALPLCYLPLGPWGVMSALCNMVMADVFMSLQLYLVFVPSHTGEDLYRWEARPRSRAESMVRQIVGTANYRTGEDLWDWLQCWVNYQIEHHLFPDVPLRTYQWIQPRVREICERHGIPYVEESVFVRFAKMFDVTAHRKPMRWVSPSPDRAGPPAAPEDRPVEVPVSAAV